MFRILKDMAKSILPKQTYGAVRDGILLMGAYGLGAVKLALFPIASAYMWWLNLKQPTKLTAFHSARIGHLALNTDLFLRTTPGGGGI